ncbi:MAG: hypothetical protein U9R32_00535 [Bacteroidota bacterium]|nr:hypothetical protein [Bacteroidota bacterium]
MDADNNRGVFTPSKLIILTLIITLFSACFNNNGEESDLPIYTIDEIIVNPPDSFLINIPLKSYSNTNAFIRFADNAVWCIKKQSAANSIIHFDREEGAEHPIIINIIDSIAFEKDILYVITGDNNNYQESRIAQLKFKKLTTDYISFYKKL